MQKLASLIFCAGGLIGLLVSCQGNTDEVTDNESKYGSTKDEYRIENNDMEIVVDMANKGDVDAIEKLINFYGYSNLHNPDNNKKYEIWLKKYNEVGGSKFLQEYILYIAANKETCEEYVKYYPKLQKIDKEEARSIMLNYSLHNKCF